MNRIFLILLFLSCIFQAYAQKPAIDSSVYNKWLYPIGLKISNDGKYTIYNLGNASVSRLIVQATETNWKFETDEPNEESKMTADSKFCIFLTKSDSLGMINFNSKIVSYIPKVSRFSVPDQGTGEYLVYLRADENLIVRNLRTGKENHFSKVVGYNLSEDGKSLTLIRSIAENKEQESLDWLNLKSEKLASVYKGKGGGIGSLSVDFKHEQLAFKAGDSIWYYKIGMSQPRFLVNTSGHDVAIGRGLRIEYVDGFSKNGERLLLTLLEIRQKLEDPLKVPMPEIWSYTDAKLQSLQENDSKVQRSYKASFSINNNRIVQIQKYKNESFIGLNDYFDDWILSSHQLGDVGWNESVSNIASQRQFEMINAKTGERRSLNWLNNNPTLQHRPNNAILSPEKKYIICYDPIQKAYLSYNIQSGKIVNLTNVIQKSWLIRGSSDYYERGIAGWLPNDEGVLVYDSHDIWQLDPSGKAVPINITNDYGFKNHIIFNLLPLKNLNGIISGKEKLVLSAFNTENKDNGFFCTQLKIAKDPTKLFMGPDIWFAPQASEIYYNGSSPIKARNSNTYVVWKSNTKEAGNYFITLDFKTFKRITDFNPQKNYNWYTTELHSWKSLDGRSLQGVLYKPENFDPNRKYPVIFYYYQKLSDGLNEFIQPQYSAGIIDIPTYVSNGYLVFSPDIFYTKGNPMQGTYDALVSAAGYLSRLAFVNSKKMGIQGHSFGGIQTNYLVTHTNIFAAACTGSGVSDMISNSGNIAPDGTSLLSNYEAGQYRMDSPLWGNLEGYITNSPIFYVDKVKTPLLIMHTKNDQTCLYPNAMEFFLGLRRLGKKAWMLVYSESNHALVGQESKDFTIRMMQFFDHYLKDKPAPKWMLEGISASRREIDSGLELDSTGRTPGPGILTTNEQAKVDSLMMRKPITIIMK